MTDLTLVARQSETFVQRAVELADQDALRMALFHNTRDLEVGALPPAARMSAEERGLLKRKAVAWLMDHAGEQEPAVPSDADLRAMCEMALGSAMGDLEYEARKEITSFREFPWLAEWSGDRPAIPAGFKVAIIGGGFAGLITAVQMQILGIDYVVLERQPENGGVWTINRYPDVRVDTISVTYELPFVKKVPWKEYFARGADVRAHIAAGARQFGVLHKTLFSHDVTQMEWDEQRQLWALTVKTPDGEELLEANCVISCSGLFATPNIPDFPGRERFKGAIVHPSQWPADLTLAGKRVAVIGNGSTGVQMVNAISDEAASVAVFQRTPQWIMPRDKYGEAIEPEVAWLLQNMPGYSNWWRFTATAPLFETHGLVTVDPEWRAQHGTANAGTAALREQLTRYIAEQTGGRQDLIDRLMPAYEPFARRPIVDNNWYKALTKGHVRLVTEGIRGFTEDGIELETGEVVALDVVVTATGFAVQKWLWPIRVIGRDGLNLHESWDAGDGPRAYVGMMHHHFPNLFTIYGPNSQPISGGPSQPAWFSTWAAYAARQIMGMLRQGKRSVEVREDAYRRYNEELDAEAAKLVLMSDLGGGGNYYVNDKHKRLQVNQPWYAPRYWQMCSEPVFEDVDYA